MSPKTPGWILQLTDHPIPQYHCPKCGTELTSATNITSREQAPPAAGDVTICIACGHTMMFTIGNTLREMSKSELARARKNPELRQAERVRRQVVHPKHH